MAKASRKFERRTLQRLNAAALAARGQPDRAERLIRCVLQDERREVTGYRTWRCQQRNCLICGWRYWRGFTRRYTRKLEKPMYTDCRFSLLTLTIPNTPSLCPELYYWLLTNLKKLMHRYPLNDRMVGAVARVETDFNSASQDFHVHIHIILIYRLCIPQEAIAAAWSDLIRPMLGDYSLSDMPGRASVPCLVWIEKIKPNELKRTISYLFKSRPFEDAEAFAEYDCAVRSVRLVQAYGSLFERKRKARRC